LKTSFNGIVPVIMTKLGGATETQLFTVDNTVCDWGTTATDDTTEDDRLNCFFSFKPI